LNLHRRRKGRATKTSSNRTLTAPAGTFNIKVMPKPASNVCDRQILHIYNQLRIS
jgi:hypothetical protein